MKPFSLEEYLANPNRKVITRNGRNVRIVCTDAKGTYPVVGLVAYENYELAFNAMKDGRIDGILDLFFAPEKHEGWVNVYKSGINWSLGASIWQTEKEAKKWVGAADYTTTIKIEWEG